MINLKKRAIFELLGVLKKQSGKLFLAKRHNVDSQEARGSHKFKRGAMFGLDARIALAIFGALSVISGAALYSAIKQANTTQVVAQLQEYAKGIEQYLLDTGGDISTVNEQVNAINLVENKDSNVGWSGPYFSAKKSVNDFELLDIPYGSNKHMFIKEAKASISWSDPGAADCDGSNDCYLWVELNCFSNIEVKTLDIVFDGVNDSANGKFRYASCPSDPITYKFYYQTVRTINQ
ncbi:MAG TPA: hypothetical protein DCL21_03745 [Alphaproteobacteria bacterium]|nr:hypothetical protein [Alphaproteobacteria bacterium]